MSKSWLINILASSLLRWDNFEAYSTQFPRWPSRKELQLPAVGTCSSPCLVFTFFPSWLPHFPPTDSCTSQINDFHPNPSHYLTFKIMWSIIFFMYSCYIIIPKRILKKALNLFSKFKILKIDRYSHY